MGKNQKIALAVGIGVMILLNIVIFGCLLADFFSGSNEPEETVSMGEVFEKTTDESTSMPEESGSEEQTQDESVSEELITGQIPLKEAKIVLHAFTWGSGENQLGYDKGDGYTLCPQAFVVENESLYVLDEANRRILIYADGLYSERDISSLSESWNLVCQNGWLGVLGKDEEGYVTLLYREDGGVGMTIRVPETVTYFGAVTEILEIGDTHVVWKAVSTVNDRSRIAYCYDWTDGSLETMNIPYYKVSESEYKPYVLGEFEGRIYYSYSDDDSFIKVINREDEEYRLYTKVSYATCYAIPQSGEYLSTDGRLYLLECLEDGVEISELVLDMDDAIIQNYQETETSATEKSTEEQDATELINAEVSLSDIKTAVYTFFWGEGKEQLGFYGDIDTDGIYTRAFAVEEGNFYVLDEVHRRILICEGGQCSAINISQVSQPSGMVYGNGLFAVYDESRNMTMIFNKDGSVEASVETPVKFRGNGASVDRLMSVEDTYVELAVSKDGFDGAQVLRYDRVYDTWELKGKKENIQIFGDYEIYIFDTLAGISGYNLYRNTDRYRLYTTSILDPNYPAMDGQFVSLSADGHLYMIEYFEDRAEISELSLEEEDAIIPGEVPAYDVLDEYFAQREMLYTVAEKPEFDPERWEYLQEWKKQGGYTIHSAEVSYHIEKVLNETETEVKLVVFESEKLEYVCDGYEVVESMSGSLPHIIRLVKHGEGYVVSSDSCYDMFTNYEVGLKEDIELLKSRGW